MVITDRSMPIMPGEKLAREVKKIREEVPVLMCTGHSGKVGPEMLRSNGLEACLRKPLAIREVAEKVRHVLDSVNSSL